MKKIKREDVVEAIIALQKRHAALEREIVRYAEEKAELTAQGEAAEGDVKLFYAKKIRLIGEQADGCVRRAQILLYDIALLEKLKSALDDMELFGGSSAMRANKLLCNRKALMNYLSRIEKARTAQEKGFIGAEELLDGYLAEAYLSPLCLSTREEEEILTRLSGRPPQG